MLLIGSELLWRMGALDRAPKDTDWIMTYDEYSNFVRDHGEYIQSHYPLTGNKNVIIFKSGRIHEVEIAWEGSSGEALLNIIGNRFLNKEDSIDLCYTLKMSHRYLKNSPHFLKTMEDIHTLREMGAKIPEYLAEWFIHREKDTYTYSHPKLNRSKKEFFDTPGVTYQYDHDSLHEAVKFGDKPAYQYFKEEQAEVQCSKELFDELPDEIKIHAVVEESMVLALERCLIPFYWKIPERKAFLMALEKVCTSITSGWFREYAWENYYTAVRVFDRLESLETLFDNGITTGVIYEADN